MWMVTLPCPSTRVSGRIVYLRVLLLVGIIGVVPFSRISGVLYASATGLPGQQRHQGVPDGIRRRRAARDEIVDLDDLVAGVDPVQQERDLRIVGDDARRDCRRPGDFR